MDSLKLQPVLSHVILMSYQNPNLMMAKPPFVSLVLLAGHGCLPNRQASGRKGGCFGP